MIIETKLISSTRMILSCPVTRIINIYVGYCKENNNWKRTDHYFSFFKNTISEHEMTMLLMTNHISLALNCEYDVSMNNLWYREYAKSVSHGRPIR